MTFLQPLLLFGLPLVALPILIHLINRWRHRTLPWGAMMFLLDAKRLTRGMARLRFWLIMLSRMLAIGALIFAVARPLTSGWLGLAVGGRADTTIVLLDRSASMEQLDPNTRRSKRSAALDQLASLFESQGHGSRVVLVESTANVAREVDPTKILELPDTAATATSADLPAMLAAALEYVNANQSGRTDLWICSDLRENDWTPDDGRWNSIRNGFQRREGTRFYLLSYSQPAADNLAVRVANVRQRNAGRKRELVFDVSCRRESEDADPLTIPVEFVINGARSLVKVEMTGNESLLLGHSIALDETTTAGWGRVELPADENLLDNVSCFVFSEPAVRQTTIVSDDPAVAKTLRLAATAPLNTSLSFQSTVLSAAQADRMDWSSSSLILWQADLPDGVLADQLAGFVRSGRPVLFFPPEGEQAKTIFGLGWGDWQTSEDAEFVPVASWRGDSDLLANTHSSEPLPIGKLRIFRHRPIRGEGGSPLARLEGGQPLLTRAMTIEGPAYFCATLPVLSHSSLAQDGVAFYAMIQRALEVGAATQGNAQQVSAGTPLAREVVDWQPAGEASRELLLSTRWLYAGTYQQGEKWKAVNRPAGEDLARVLGPNDVDRLFSSLDYRLVEQNLGQPGPLASEIWRAILALMGLALIAEACLCLPERRAGMLGRPSAEASNGGAGWDHTGIPDRPRRAFAPEVASKRAGPRRS